MEEMDNLLGAIKFAEFPIVARLHSTSDLGGRCKIDGKEVLIQRHLKVKYALVKVLDFDRKHEVQDKKGIDFVMEHDNCVDKIFLIPSKYNASLRFIHRPGSRKRFASIAQVLRELPRFVLACEETIAVPSNGIGKNVIIPEKTLLEIVRKVSQGGTTYLECSDGKDTFSFRETDRINFTEAEDEKLYRMYELVRLKLLPKPFQFQDIEPEDVVHMDEELNSSMLTVAEGPLDLIKFVEVEIVVGWIRDDAKRTYKTIVIPSRLWPLIKMQNTPFSDQDAKRKYIERRYNNCNNSDFVERKLYGMQMNEGKIIWLANPDFYVRNYSGNCMFDVVPIHYKDSIEDDDEIESTDMFQCPPPVPDKPSWLKNQNMTSNNVTKVKNKRKTMTKIHQTLKKLWKPKRIQKSNDANESEDIGVNARLQNRPSIAHQNIQTQTKHFENNLRIKQRAKGYKKQQHGYSIMEKDVSQYLGLNEDSPKLYHSNKNINRDSYSQKLSFSDEYAVSVSDASDSESSLVYDYVEPDPMDRSRISPLEHKSNLQLTIEEDSSQYLHPSENHPQFIESNENKNFELSPQSLSFSEKYAVSDSDKSDSESSVVYDYVEPDEMDRFKLSAPENRSNLQSSVEKDSSQNLSPKENAPQRIQSNRHKNMNLSSPNMYFSEAYSDSYSNKSDDYEEPGPIDLCGISPLGSKSNLQSMNDSDQYLHPDKDSPLLIQLNKNINISLSSSSILETYSVSDTDTSDDYVDPEPIYSSKIDAPEHKIDLHSVDVQIDELNEARFKAKIDCFHPATKPLPLSKSKEVICMQKISFSTRRNENVFFPNKSEEFYGYSVVEIAECFKLCGLNAFAEKCQENKLDGSFFKSFDLQLLKKEPFNFTGIGMSKIRKIIFEGWRPKI